MSYAMLLPIVVLSLTKAIRHTVLNLMVIKILHKVIKCIKTLYSKLNIHLF